MYVAQEARLLSLTPSQPLTAGFRKRKRTAANKAVPRDDKGLERRVKRHEAKLAKQRDKAKRRGKAESDPEWEPGGRQSAPKAARPRAPQTKGRAAEHEALLAALEASDPQFRTRSRTAVDPGVRDMVHGERLPRTVHSPSLQSCKLCKLTAAACLPAGVRVEEDGSQTYFRVSTACFFKKAGYTRHAHWIRRMREKHPEQAEWEAKLPPKAVASLAALQKRIEEKSSRLESTILHYFSNGFREKRLEVCVPRLLP